MTSEQTPGAASGSWPARARPRFTSRAAVLIVVVCAIALSLAYPVREYLAQLRQIDQLKVQQAQINSQLHQLQAQRRELASPAYVEQQARDRLHMCLPTQTCYVIISGNKRSAKAPHGAVAVTPWYGRLWTSVQQADKVSGK